MKTIDAILKDVNSILGVQGCFVCLGDGSIAAQALPDERTNEQVVLVARVACQTFQALQVSGQRVSEADLTFEQGRLLLRNLRGGILVILCARNINLPLLNLTANVAVKKLTEELRPVKAPTREPAVTLPAAPKPAPPAPVPTAAPPAAPIVRAVDDTVFAGLESEWRRIVNEANASQTVLRVMNSLAIWLCCPQARALLAPPEKNQLDFAARASQRESIRRTLEHLGYQTAQSSDEFRSSPRLYFSHLTRGIVTEIYLDSFAMYHQFDLTPFLAQESMPLPETALLLLRLQLVEMPEAGLRELNALLLNHDVSSGPEAGKIDVSQIVRLCADHWGWYKTVMQNLQRVMGFAIRFITTDDKVIVVERAEQIIQKLEDAPKSLRWQTRARLVESVRWYDLPATPTPEQRAPELRYVD